MLQGWFSKMNFQAKDLIELVGEKKPTNPRKKFVIRLLNCIRDLRSNASLNRKQIDYLLYQIEQRDKMIDELREKNIALLSQRLSEHKPFQRLNIVA